MAQVPYCGPPPRPATLWASWNLDPILLVVLASCLLAGALAARDGPQTRRGAVAAGWTITAFAFVSPLCALGVALFSARIAQHLVLTLVAAPLLVAGCDPGVAVERGGARRGFAVVAPWAAFTACLWIWHLPGPYDATLASDRAYWASHLTLFASALWLWRALLRAGGADGLVGAALAAAAALSMGLLGALLTFAPTALFASHVATAPAWGLTALEDQQLGGLLCWVPGCGVLALAGLRGVAGALRSPAALRPAVPRP